MQMIAETCRQPLPEGCDMAAGLVELIDQYLAERVARGELNGASPVTIRSVLVHFSRHVAELGLDELTERDIETWIADPNLKPATRHSRVNKVKPFIRWLAARDFIVKDFAALMKAPKVPPGMPRYLGGEEVRVLVRACRTNRDRLIVLLMVHLGLRRIEVSRIDLEDLDFDDRLLGVRGKNGQGRITRVLPIDNDEVWKALHAYLAERPASTGPLLRNHLSEKRMQGNKVGEMVIDLMRATGIKRLPRDGMSAHALRHTCAQELIDAGHNIRLVQSALGHRSVATTELYLRRQPPGLRDALKGRSYA